MAATDETDTGVLDDHPRFCPKCGHPVADANFCPECGTQTGHWAAVPPPPPVQPPSAPPPPAASAPQPPAPPAQGVAQKSAASSRTAALLAGGAVAVVIVAVLVIVLLSGGSSSPNASPTTIYHQKLTAAFAPVLEANTALSTSLQALHGTSTASASAAIANAQSAVTGTRAAVAVLTVPASQSALAQQAQVALTQETGYLQAVQAVLSDPSASNSSQLTSLATTAQTQFVNLGSITPNGDQTIGGTYALTSWSAGRVAAAQAAANRRTQNAARQGAQQGAQSGNSSASSSSGSSSGGSSPSTPGGTDCGNGLYAGPDTSCPFAENVQQAWQAAPGETNTVQVYSPVTGQTYTMNCAPAGSGITCSGGNNASVSW